MHRYYFGCLLMIVFLAATCFGRHVIATPCLPQDGEFEGYSVAEHTANDNEKMSYLFMTKDDAEEPEDGFKLVLILPGGDGSAEFQNFCRRIHQNALPDGYVAAELVAPIWNEDENSRIVWPTKKLNPDKADFTTEEFINSVVASVAEQVKIDERYVFTLGWSSGGPPIYSAAMQDDTKVTGTFVAMSVFHPQALPKMRKAKGHAFYLLHSPDDWIKIDQHARVAEEKLGRAGGKVKLTTYKGGHGWRDDPYGHIRRGVEWLEKQNDE